MGLSEDEVLSNEIAEKDRQEMMAEAQSTQDEADALNDYLDEQARLRHLEQSGTPTGQEM